MLILLPFTITIGIVVANVVADAVVNVADVVNVVNVAVAVNVVADAVNFVISITINIYYSYNFY